MFEIFQNAHITAVPRNDNPVFLAPATCEVFKCGGDQKCEMSAGIPTCVKYWYKYYKNIIT